MLTFGPRVPATLRIYSAGRHLECVPYARSVSSVALWGDAWTWWRSAERGYRRDNRPAVGSVLVLKRTNHLTLGHVSVVSRVVNSREILVYHANWLNRGRIYEDLPVRDVSPANDWSMVRVWYPPGRTLGKRAYPAHGFIHPSAPRTLALNQPPVRGPDVRVVQEALVNAGFPVTPDGIFGPATSHAVQAYQAQLGLSADGAVGPATWARLGI
jgi:murein L,D-transpeptidase YcbB/YkuD